jgi:hypothetical protein
VIFILISSSYENCQIEFRRARAEADVRRDFCLLWFRESRMSECDCRDFRCILTLRSPSGEQCLPLPILGEHIIFWITL